MCMPVENFYQINIVSTNPLEVTLCVVFQVCSTYYNTINLHKTYTPIHTQICEQITFFVNHRKHYLCNSSSFTTFHYKHFPIGEKLSMIIKIVVQFLKYVHRKNTQFNMTLHTIRCQKQNNKVPKFSVI